MSDEPQIIRMAPGSIVQMVNDPTPHFVLQSPNEIRKLRAALKQDEDLGLGDGGGEADESGLLDLVGLDLYGDGDIESYDLAIHPGWLLMAKQVTPRAWEAHQVSVGIDPKKGVRFQEVEKRTLRETPQLILSLKAAGVKVDVVEAGRYFVELETNEGELQAGRHMMSGVVLLSVDSDGDEICCCGHPAADHFRGPKVIEGCRACGVCGIFHRHLEEEDDDGQAEEQPAP